MRHRAGRAPRNGVATTLACELHVLHRSLAEPLAPSARLRQPVARDCQYSGAAALPMCNGGKNDDNYKSNTDATTTTNEMRLKTKPWRPSMQE